jgi:hypothetical protein
MLLEYSYKGDSYKVFIEWTADTGHSTVFRDIVAKVSGKHRFPTDCYSELAKELDGLTDKLYEGLYAVLR